MNPGDRRSFLKSIAALTAAGTLPASIAKAMALPANSRTGTIADVEHIVVLMQENRAFDHYFGTVRGVRGYGDPRPVMLRSGKSVFHQPTPDGAGTVLPFHMDSATTSGPLIKSLDHSWKGDAAEWANYDVWIKHKTPLTMGYFTRSDIPFYHALADAFTIGDAYYASIHGPTNPNRMFLFSGTSGLSVGDAGKQAVDNADDGNWTGDMARDKPDFVAAGWTTYAERLQASGVSWHVYQEFDNFGDNSLAYFKSFRGLAPDHELAKRGRAVVAGSTPENAAASSSQHLVDAFAADVAANRLPQVSWIVAPTKYSEHPEAPPALGESLTSRLLDALTANPAVWAKTAFIINYDENDGFFDHMPGLLPATHRKFGLSTVDTRGESYEGQPVGLGVRVPLIVVSPWTRGGWVNSQVFDHTSIIRFIERRFGVMEPNISPWRRAITGDLTSMFDFRDPDRAALQGLPSTADAMARVIASSKLPAPLVPAVQSLPVQEAGQRPARALPYRLAVDDITTKDGQPGLRLDFVNDGSAAAVFGVYAPSSGADPWFYTVGAGQRVDDRPPGLAIKTPYAIAVHGPNGFLREFAGDPGSAVKPGVYVDYARDHSALLITVSNHGVAACTLAIRPLAYSAAAVRQIKLAPGVTQTIHYPVAASDHWYDVIVEDTGSGYSRRFAGHVETGRPSRSDPALGTVA
ncbi:phospholipase C, phosphocholine-specific [Sphingosinicellaceae bacterium]|nr:phospholipase C, phosphocholine-specific [Sphingosinicellaceae bacterium]